MAQAEDNATAQTDEVEVTTTNDTTVETKAVDGVTTKKTTDAAAAAAETAEAAATEDANDDDVDEKKEVSIYSDPILPRIEVGNGYRTHRPLNFYVDRARRILRTEKTLEVTGHGLRVSKACTLVEVLKRQKIAKVASVSTGMETQPYFSSRPGRGRYGDAMWSQPTTVIRFTLEQAEFAAYVSDYHQRKVIEIFEKTDADSDGKLSFDEIDALDMPTAFFATDEQIEEGKEFLAANGEPDKSLNLPNFIKYASILIHPLLKDDLFKKALSDNYKIVTGDPNKREEHDD